MRISFFLLLTLFTAYSSYAQLTVESAKASGNWADYYVQEVLLGSGVTAFNATFTGCDTTAFGHAPGYDSVQIGEFTSDSTIVDIPYGLMLGSGSVEAHSGTFANPSPGPGGTDGVTDPDLALLLPNFTLNNAAVLEFDFVPQGDTIRFSYVFASTEYPTYVCSNFNDVFGFFLSGPGISGPYSNGADNLAVLPGTTTEVSINTVNDVAGGSNCSPACPCNSQYFANNYTAPTDTNVLFSGMTVTLEAVAEVICGDTYHIKMAIADAGDGVLDSGVFLEGGSFSSNLIEVNITSVNGDSTINEGCGQAEILFSRSDTVDSAITYLQISGTATNGIDYTLLPDSIVLPPGDPDTTIVIVPFADGLNEGVESLIIEAVSVTVCGDTFISTGTLYFYDIPDLTVNSSNDTTVNCPPDSLNLWAIVQSGGPPPFTYLWNTGDTTSFITVNLSPNGGIDTFVVALQDSCALTTLFDTILVTKNYADDPLVLIRNDSSVNCAGDKIELELDIVNGTPPFSYAWSVGSTNDTAHVTVNDPMNVFVTVTDDCGRSVTDSAFLGIKVPDAFTVGWKDTTIFCVGRKLTIVPEFDGGTEPYTYSWDQFDPVFDGDSALTVKINGDTTIYFWVRDVCGRRYDTNFFVNALEVDSLRAVLYPLEAKCAGEEFFLDPDVTGGLGPITYEWSTNDSDTAIVFVGSVTELVSLTVTDFCGMSSTAGALLEVPEYADLSIELSEDAELCYGDEYTIGVKVYGGAGGFTYEWIPVKDPITAELYEQVDSNVFRVISRQSNQHYIRVTDLCGSTTGDTVSIEVDPCVYIPNVITPDGDGINDAFYIENIINFHDAHLYVYNRWGQKVFEAHPYRNEWVPLEHPSGVYYYILRSENFPELRGDLTLINDKDSK